MTDWTARSHSRRAVVGASLGLAAGAALTRVAGAQDATPPAASPTSGEWTYTDVLGKTVTLPAPPVKIAASLVTAAALWDLGIKPIAVFDWTASAYPDGDHIAWGNIDAKAVANVGDIDGNLLAEDLLNLEPDIILSLSFDGETPAGVVPELAGAIEQIAPVLTITDMGSTEIQLRRLIDLAVSLGADLDAPAIVEAREAYDAKVEEFKTVAAEKADLTTLFINFDAAEIYVAGPKDVSELQFLTSLGLQFANTDSELATEFWEQLSSEEAIKYPGDVVFSDIYSAVGYATLEDLQAAPVFAKMPAVAAGQVGLWKRDFPVSYAGIADFLETILVTLRPAEDVA